jgi:hypothetical protein
VNEELPKGIAEGYWIHVLGSDDLIAAPDELTALRQANDFNLAMEKQRREFAGNPNQPVAIAVVRKQ